MIAHVLALQQHVGNLAMVYQPRTALDKVGDVGLVLKLVFQNQGRLALPNHQRPNPAAIPLESTGADSFGDFEARGTQVTAHVEGAAVAHGERLLAACDVIEWSGCFSIRIGDHTDLAVLFFKEDQLQLGFGGAADGFDHKRCAMAKRCGVSR